MRKTILYFALKYHGNYQEIYMAIKRKDKVSLEEKEEAERKIKCNYVTLVDSNYPNCLKAINTPPFILFYYGDISLLNSDNVAVIGKRRYTRYGESMARKIVKGLASYNVTIVSGMALGIDSIAHDEAMNNNMKTIAVLGSGIDYCYPIRNQEIYDRIKKNGLIISEYPNDLVPEDSNFLIRNRIIAGLSNKIIVIEANMQSGTMNTVSFGLDFGKEIYAVPSLATNNSGCNFLIKQGAKLIEGAKDIYE